MSSVQINVLAAELPAKYRALLDSSQSLSAPTVFIPAGMAGWLGPVFLLAFVAPFAIGTALTMPEAWLAWLRGLPIDLMTLWLEPLVFLISAPLTLWGIRQLRRARRQRRLHREGRWRQGLFILPEALLFNDGRHCSLLPRSSIVKIAPRQVDRPPGGRSHPAGHIVYQDDAGQLQAKWLPNPEITARLKEWVESGYSPTRSGPNSRRI